MKSEKLNISKVTGKTISLRPAEVSDYIFIHNLRKSVTRPEFLSDIPDDPLFQKQWLEKYKQRELDGQEMYFVIQKIDTNEPIGTIRAYSPDWQEKRISCGSWVLNENKPRTAAIETIMLLSKVFMTNGINHIIVDAVKEHKSALRFIRKISNRFFSEDETNLYYEIDVSYFLNNFYQEHKFHINEKKEND